MGNTLSDGIQTVENNRKLKKLRTNRRTFGISSTFIRRTLLENRIQCSVENLPLVEDLLLDELYRMIHKLKFSKIGRINEKTIAKGKRYYQ